jgi:hypothetical protein
VLASNSAAIAGGGADGCTLNNCTLVGNSATFYGGGAYRGTMNNSIAYYNTSSSYPEYFSTVLSSCCTFPSPGAGNLTNAPLFVDLAGGNYRLLPNSPCINAGLNSYVSSATDLDGRPRIVGGTVDIGAYELQPGISGSFIGWLQGYGLPTDGSADYADADQDGMNNWQEWVAGTEPTDAASALRLQAPAIALPGLLLSWSSDTNHTYFVQRATNLAEPQAFSVIEANVPGQDGTTTYTDASAPALPSAFYRVGTDSAGGAEPISLQALAWYPGSVMLTWSSVTNRSYSLERGTEVGASAAFSLLCSNIPGQAGFTGFTDTNAVTGAPCFYRMRVEQ